ncbi:MAG: spore germination protein GerW family protein [Bacillota bacterium]
MFKENVETIVTQLEKLITTRTIVGEPITSGNATILPIVSTSFGFGTGSGEGGDASKGSGKGDGGGVGAAVRPTALVIMQEGDIKVYSLAKKGTLEKLTELIPEVMAKFRKDNAPE